MKSTLKLRGVSAGYDNNRGFESTGGMKKKAVISNIDLSVAEGELVVLAGPNGSGKTTLLKTAGGLLPPLEGKVEINGKDIYSLRPRERAAFTAFLFQVRDSPWPFTVRETVEQGRFAYRGWLGSETREDREAVKAALEKADLASLADRRITELSGGELQRVYIARCLAQEAAFLLLDEPENNLDPRYSYIIMKLLAEIAGEGRGVIVSLHDLRLALRFAHRVALLSPHGVIHAIGTARETLTGENLGGVYELGTELVHDLIL